MWTIFSLLLNKLPGLAQSWFDWQAKKLNTELEGFKGAAGVDLAAFQAHLAAQVEVNKLKLAQQSWWGAKLIILVAGVPAGLHFALVMIDSTCPISWGWGMTEGRGGCGMGIPKLPSPYDTFEWVIVQSFFLVMPIQTGVNALSQWLARKK